MKESELPLKASRVHKKELAAFFCPTSGTKNARHLHTIGGLHPQRLTLALKLVAMLRSPVDMLHVCSSLLRYVSLCVCACVCVPLYLCSASHTGALYIIGHSHNAHLII